MAHEHGRRRLGKLASLGAVLLLHGPALEADFQQFYGVDLLACTPRKVWVLFNALPSESRVVREMAPEAEWGNTEYLLASVIDAIQQNTWVLASAHSKPGQGPKEPRPIARPGQKTSKVPQGGKALRRFLGV